MQKTSSSIDWQLILFGIKSEIQSSNFSFSNDRNKLNKYNIISLKSLSIWEDGKCMTDYFFDERVWQIVNCKVRLFIIFSTLASLTQILGRVQNLMNDHIELLAYPDIIRPILLQTRGLMKLTLFKIQGDIAWRIKLHIQRYISKESTKK